jgi:hypothetical protein
MRTNQDLARYLLEKLASIGITDSETNLIVRIHCHRRADRPARSRSADGPTARRSRARGVAWFVA